MELNLSGKGSLVAQVQAALRGRIESGTLAAGTRLPGSRSLARRLGISRGTVVAAYDLLVAEGYCEAHGRSGTRVAPIFAGRPASPAGSATPPPVPHPIRWRSDTAAPTWDLRSGLPNPGDFPHDVWGRMLRRASREAGGRDFDYPHPEGLPRLRAAVAARLRRQRALACSADQVLITQGAQQAFSLIARALLPPGVPVAVEDPGYRGFGQAVRAAGVDLVPVPVDEHGLAVASLPVAPVSAAYVTPAHQFPTGVILSAARRRALLGWAREQGAWIVEDDYDSAYRFDAPPLPLLKTLDTDGRVLLVGSFSKTLFPGLRLGYLVVEREHLELLALLKNLDDAGSATLYQAALAAFMEEGHYDRHLRRSLRRNAARRQALIGALRARFGPEPELLGAASGLHVVVRLGLDVDQEREVVRRARSLGLGLHALASFCQGDRPITGLMLAYSGLEPSQLEAAVDVLARTVREVRRQPPGRRTPESG